MPIYEYKCVKCRAKKEVLVKDTSVFYPFEWCDECDCNMDRVISTPSISFKGPGFHSNDYDK